MRETPGEVVEFLETHRISVLAAGIADNYIHAATLCYSFTAHPLHFYFSTIMNTRKVTGLIGTDSMNAALVIGFQEKEWMTFQADGSVRIIKDKQHLAKVHKQHIAKFPENKGSEKDDMSIFLEFTPFWWRFSDFTVYPVHYTASDMVAS